MMQDSPLPATAQVASQQAELSALEAEREPVVEIAAETVGLTDDERDGSNEVEEGTIIERATDARLGGVGALHVQAALRKHVVDLLEIPLPFVLVFPKTE